MGKQTCIQMRIILEDGYGPFNHLYMPAFATGVSLFWSNRRTLQAPDTLFACPNHVRHLTEEAGVGLTISALV